MTLSVAIPVIYGFCTFRCVRTANYSELFHVNALFYILLISSSACATPATLSTYIYYNPP